MSDDLYLLGTAADTGELVWAEYGFSYASVADNRLCSWCRRRPALEGRRNCADCADDHRLDAAIRRQARKAGGRCTRCGSGRDRDDRVLCGDCRRQQRGWYLGRRAERRCTGCGRPLDRDGARCEACCAKTRAPTLPLVRIVPRRGERIL